MLDEINTTEQNKHLNSSTSRNVLGSSTLILNSVASSTKGFSDKNNSKSHSCFKFTNAMSKTNHKNSPRISSRNEDPKKSFYKVNLKEIKEDTLSGKNFENIINNIKNDVGQFVNNKNMEKDIETIEGIASKEKESGAEDGDGEGDMEEKLEAKTIDMENAYVEPKE
jgi:hypothetical protein